jgi:ankyrin repeat domain-containing protein 50
VIRYLCELERSSGGVICVSFVYLRYSESLSIRDVLESLVRQIVERHDDLVPLITEVYARHKREGTKPAQEELMCLLAGFITAGKSLFFVLDALDEMRAKDRPVLLKLLASLDTKLFITSRPLEPIQKQYPHAQMFEISASRADIELHFQEFLQHSPEVVALLEGTELKQHIAETIHQMSGGM